MLKLNYQNILMISLASQIIFQMESNSPQSSISQTQSSKWHPLETRTYFFYLVLHFSRFTKPDPSRNKDIFKGMSKFVSTRSQKQCKSHHEKIMGRKTDVPTRITPVLKQFYKQHYRLRYLPFQHCLKEFKELMLRIEEYWDWDSQWRVSKSEALQQFKENWLRVLPSEEERGDKALPSDLPRSKSVKEVQIESSASVPGSSLQSERWKQAVLNVDIDELIQEE